MEDTAQQLNGGFFYKINFARKNFLEFRFAHFEYDQEAISFSKETFLDRQKS